MNVPNMPLFEPSHDPSDQRVFHDHLHLTLGDTLDDVGPAFWEEFKSQVKLHKNAQDMPLVQVQDGKGECHVVSKRWLQGFAGGWLETFPHDIIIHGPEPEAFRATNKFWEDATAAFYGRNGDIQIESEAERARPFWVTMDGWNEFIYEWELKNRCTYGERSRILAQRALESEAYMPFDPPSSATPQRNDGGQIPSHILQLPHMSLSPTLLNGIAVSSDDVDNLEKNLHFSTDTNFWSCFKRFIAWMSEAAEQPVCVVENADDQVTVSKVFLCKFTKAWIRQFPLSITVALREGGVLYYSFFYAHSPVWHEITLRSSGFATREQTKVIPSGFCLTHSSDSPNNLPMLISIQAFNEVARLWPDQFPIGGDSFEMQLKEERRKGRKAPRAPCVALPRPEKPNRRRRVPGAPHKSKQPEEMPTVTLCLHKEVYQGMGYVSEPLVPQYSQYQMLSEYL